MFCDITDLAFPNYICMQEVLPDFTDAIQHHKMFYSSDFKETKKKKRKNEHHNWFKHYFSTMTLASDTTN